MVQAGKAGQMQSQPVQAAPPTAAGTPRPARLREVHNVEEMRAAMNDSSVDHVMLMRPDGWNVTEETFPPHSVYIRNRSLLLEGSGPGFFHFDMNLVQDQVIILDGGNLTQRNIWADHCFHGKPPYSCFTKMGPGGWGLLHNFKVSDASCTNTQHSVSIATSLMFIRFGSFLGGTYDVEHLDTRTVLVKDTGWLRSPDVAAYLRVINTTFSCTGNITHPVPPETRLVILPVWQQYLLLVGGLALLFLTAGLFWCWHRRARESSLPEHRIAESRGFLLEEPLGSGHFGRVYRGRTKSLGQLVAIKVIDLLPSQRRQLVYACRECQLMSRVQHPSIVRVVTFYAAQVQARPQVVELTPGIEYVEIGFNVASIIDGSTAAAWASSQEARYQGSANGSGGSSVAPNAGGGSRGPPTNSGGSTASSSDGMEGVLSTQANCRPAGHLLNTIHVQLVMQYCDLGTLEQSVRAGMFRDAETGQVKLRHILATGLEIAEGLEYLHHSDRRMVHRDLSATNILLTTSAADDRGFRALLSDFGLTTSLSEEQTHKTSEVKGTLSYMSPELFLRDDVSPALDVYSLGIILHLMYSGADPYADQGPAVIILAKVLPEVDASAEHCSRLCQHVRASEHPEEARLPPLEGCPQAYQQLVWDCTHAERRSRPTAAQVVRRLRAQLAATT
ncbi:hypothetical protein CHLNCDRAFT_58735 [Chlorella variabilis]|uniref:Protein kinase domain-containing protein n=1 Tax=Chlorella variabilis TaxID=554065 RepID=E1ZMT6_CHLVA|nr:hypothetical protein CHLNCDRAFT_58735 [Chlorella variabilis]EFN52748.1 hypothetical protein CHLNCDRAFT_58735 [Chlorella variabilis]|eukprot:XP_005844850.1 hypothetical protein CHLNCDRAFT_58735 [Chlorella variabilis]